MPQEETLYDLAELFKVFGDSTRIKILWALDESEMCVCDIAFLLNMTQSAISHQLRVLKQAGLVKSRREGKTVFYSLEDEHVKQIFDQGLIHISEESSKGGSVMLKKEVILEGLDCANCAAKIEDEVNKLNGVKAYMNFMNKTLTLEIESEQEYKNILQQVKTIVHKHEPDVVVKEKSVNKSNKIVLILEGLGCANCAAKIEKEISGLEGVEFAAVDFCFEETNTGNKSESQPL